MKLIIENIGKVTFAEVDINQIALIVSENNSGKSTISKVLFIVVKVMSNIKNLIQLEKNREIENLTRQIEMRFTNYDILLDEEWEEFDDDEYEYEDDIWEREEFLDILEFAFIDNYFEKYKKIRKLDFDYFMEFSIDTDQDSNNDIIKGKLDYLKEIVSYYNEILDTQDFDAINLYINKIKNIIEMPNIDLISKVFEVYFNEEFNNQHLKIGSKKGSIKIYENSVNILDLEISNESFEVRHIKNIYSNDVTYIESPYIFSNFNNYSYFRYQKDNSFASKTKDLMQKLVTTNRPKVIEDLSENKILSELEKVIGGKVQYSSMSKRFSFVENDFNLDFGNTASGIKQLGILILLLQNKIFNEYDVLIMDEPEVHLHPKWQLKLAEIIVILVKEYNLRVFINSHSTHFIEFINVYSKYYDINVNFYSFNLENPCNLNNVNDNISEIYERLNKPYDEIDKILAKLHFIGEDYE